MLVTIELRHGPNHSSHVSPRDFDAQIETLERIAATGRASPIDAVQLLDTASILRSIQRKLAGSESPVCIKTGPDSCIGPGGVTNGTSWSIGKAPSNGEHK